MSKDGLKVLNMKEILSNPDVRLDIMNSRIVNIKTGEVLFDNLMLNREQFERWLDEKAKEWGVE